jgi:hypothetical protein
MSKAFNLKLELLSPQLEHAAAERPIAGKWTVGLPSFPGLDLHPSISLATVSDLCTEADKIDDPGSIEI